MSKLVIALVIAIILIIIFIAASSGNSPAPVTPVATKPTTSSAPKPSAPSVPKPSTPIATAIAATTNFCYRYAINPMRTLVYQSNDCAAPAPWNASDSNVGSGGNIKGFKTKQPGTEKYCYRHASNPDRTLLYRSDDCTSQWGWGAEISSYGSGGEIFLYPNEQPNTEKYCYRYSSNPTRTLFYKSNDCSSKWGWGANDAKVGAGGEVWLPK
jgi:hypothetical protein